MKNISLLIFLLSTITAFGQNRELYINYGSHFLGFNTNNPERNFTVSGEDFISQWPINYNKPGLVDVPSSRKSFLASQGIFTLGYNVRKGRHVLGGLFNFEKQTMTHKTNVFAVEPIELGQVNQMLEVEFIGLKSLSESSIKNYSLAFRYDYNWVFKDKLKLYSGLSIGAGLRYSSTLYYDVSYIQDQFPEVIEDFLRYKSKDFMYHLHFNALGLRYGKDWAFVAELGLGHRGYINIGISHLISNSAKNEKPMEVF